MYNGLRPEDAEILQTRNKVAMFDGRRAHEVTEFTGRRTSVVWFASKRPWEIDRDIRSDLERLGFRPPSHADECSPAAWFSQACDGSGVPYIPFVEPDDTGPCPTSLKMLMLRWMQYWKT